MYIVSDEKMNGKIPVVSYGFYLWYSAVLKRSCVTLMWFNCIQRRAAF